MGAAPSFFRHYRMVDFATQGYVALVGVLVLAFGSGRVAGFGWIAVAHGAGLLLIHGLIEAGSRDRGGRVLAALRHLYPILLYAAFYRETGLVNRMFFSAYLDPVLIRAEESVFGGQPSLFLMERFPQRWVSEILYAAYFSYYVMIGGVGIALYLRDARAFDHYVSVVSVVFYLCYLFYIVVPVIGARAYFLDWTALGLPAELLPSPVPPFPASVTDGFFYGIMKWIYRNFEAEGAAFPSSHVAISLVTVFFSFRYLPRIAWPHAGVAVLLCLATVYCRYHYALDVVAGVITTAVLLPLANAAYRRCGAGDRKIEGMA